MTIGLSRNLSGGREQGSGIRDQRFHIGVDIFVHLIYSRKMPELSRFYGIVIYMFAKDHVPPHFHAKYGEYIGVFDIETGELIEGGLPRRALRLVQE